MHAVVGLLPPDDDLLARPADLVPVAAGELGGGVDRVGSAGGEEHLRPGDRRDRGQAFGQFDRRRGREVAEVRVVSDRIQSAPQRPDRSRGGRARCSRTTARRSRRGSGCRRCRRCRRPHRGRRRTPRRARPRPCRRSHATVPPRLLPSSRDSGSRPDPRPILATSPRTRRRRARRPPGHRRHGHRAGEHAFDLREAGRPERSTGATEKPHGHCPPTWLGW